VPDEATPDASAHLHPLSIKLLDEFVRARGDSAQLVVDEDRQWLTLEETQSGIGFVDVYADYMRIVPLVGDAEPFEGRPAAASVGPSWLDGEREITLRISELAGEADRSQLMSLLIAALDFWVAQSRRGSGHEAARIEPDAAILPSLSRSGLDDVDFTRPAEADQEQTAHDDEHVGGRIQADISDQWSWASSAARIPQISALEIEVVNPVEHGRVTVTVRDADLTFALKVAHEGTVAAGTTTLGSVHVPLSTTIMSTVEERRSADCLVTLEDLQTGRTLARLDCSIDIQPRDLWIWAGDPRRSALASRLEQRWLELETLVVDDDPRLDKEAIRQERDEVAGQLLQLKASNTHLARSLLASFVRPNHPEVAIIAREAADRLGLATGDPSFQAFQLPDIAEAERRADSTVSAVYEALQARRIAYSEPPPGWDYESEGQRIRDHGDVARGGLGTCMDTTVLMAAVLEHVGLLPVLVLIPGHIFIGYWRRNPFAGTGATPDWYPNAPFIDDLASIHGLVGGGWLGLIETTAFTAGKQSSAGQARAQAGKGLATGLLRNSVGLIDVAVARKAGVSPLPTVSQRTDGVIEILEYRPGGATEVTEVHEDDLPVSARQRFMDHHPARYRTWKASLFKLNATNALLSLGRNAQVQPIVLPATAVGRLEDKLNQDVSFSILSGYRIPEVWKARGLANACQLLDSGVAEDEEELLNRLGDRQIFVQRIDRRGSAVSEGVFARELRSMAHGAKTAFEERGMNPLFLCLGILRWQPKPGAFADAPLILVPVKISVSRGRDDFTLSLDSSQQTTPNAALLEWLRREHGLSIPGLAEPLADRAGIDVDGVLTEVRRAVAESGLALAVSSEARIATLDLTAFRMWQDLNLHAEAFIQRPLVRHLVETPTQVFEDPAAAGARDDAAEESTADELESLDTPIPADATQKRAVLWASQGRTFVLQGPPGTGKSQTITNMIAECVTSGLKVLFVAEKGTALSVVQKRLDAIGLDPFTLNLHHEGSNAAAVRAQLKRSLTTSVTPDPAALESARRRIRNARYELTQYPQRLHEPNAAGFSAYSAHDELHVLGDGPELELPFHLVTHEPERLEELRELFGTLQQWTSAAGVRSDHPWRLAGRGDGDPFEVETTASAVRGVLDGAAWSSQATGSLRQALDSVRHPRQLVTLAAAANQALPLGEELGNVLRSEWPTLTAAALDRWVKSMELATAKLHGFSPEVIDLDLESVLSQWQAATSSGIFGRGKRQATALAPLTAIAPAGTDLAAPAPAAILGDLIAAQSAAAQVRSEISSTAGLSMMVPDNPLLLGALDPVRARIDELVTATTPLRDSNAWTEQVAAMAISGSLISCASPLIAYATAWDRLWQCLEIDEDDFTAWLGSRSLLEATQVVESLWRRQVDYERLLPLQNWCILVRKLEPLRTVGLHQTRAQILEGILPAYLAEDALVRGIARTALTERISASGMDRFNAVAHDERVQTYAQAQAEMRKQWTTDAPSALLARRGHGGMGARTGGLARELEKTTRKLGTRAILRKHGEAVLELTPLVLCSPSSVVDLIEPGVMDFDVVIFDEASQIAVPEAIGALGRARAAIIVGDSKQMPPTRKVGRSSLEDDELLDEDNEELVEDQESILSECELARVPRLSLSWHYRSQDEALISFSNRAYYRGNLSSFPTPTLLSTETGIEFRRVKGPEGQEVGLYLRQGSSSKVSLPGGISAGPNTNPVEAVEIVNFIHTLVYASDDLPSVGIVTFNEQQRELIEMLLMRSPDSRVADVMDEAKMGRGEALFVKALEQVQGDERDTVIFSVAFSKQENGRIPINFGPLSNSGGERRLNVAVTRARRKNIIFCSFEPSELDVSGATYQGPKDLKEFLLFAKSNGYDGAQADSEGRIPIRDRHRDDIAEALRQAGLHVMSDVGLSNFRLDLVLAHPTAPDRPILPVLLDGESWRKRHTVSDRDVLPVEVLEGLMGWPSVARIWWPMWLQNRQQVIDAMLAEVDRAEALLNVPQSKAGASTYPDSSQGTGNQEREESDLTGGQAQTIQPAQPTTIPTPPETARPASVPQRPSTRGPSDRGPEPASPPGVSPRGNSLPSIPSATAFTPASTNVVGPREMLDQLNDRSVAAVVREQILDVVSIEGPIEVGRLTRIVGRRFNLNAVRSARVEEMAKLIPRGQLKKSRKFGDFVWPIGVKPQEWTGFRSSVAADRPLDEIAPEEIANAMRHVIAQQGSASGDELLRATADIFGISRLGGNIRSRLEAIREHVMTTSQDAASDSDSNLSPRQSDLVDDIAAMLKRAMQENGQGALEVGPRSIRWLGDHELGLMVEVDDGETGATPFDRGLADALVSVGWRRPRPKENLRAVWADFQLWPDEPQHRFEARLKALAELVHEGLKILRERQ